MATAAAPPRAGASEATTVFHDEPWTAEVARLLLEVDEGWVGYRGDAAWSWHEETYTAFAAVCAERRWPANSQGACVAMLHALRTGAVNMKLSRATRSSDGCAQWSLVEMRELGAQMRRVVDGQLPTARWSAQLVVFVAAMRAKDASYSIDGRSVEDFAVRAGKYIPDPILRVIDPNGDNGKTPPTEVANRRRAPTPEPQNRTTTTASKDARNDVPRAAVANTRNLQRSPTPELEERQKKTTTTAEESKSAGSSEPLASPGNTRKAQRLPTSEPEERQKRAKSQTRKSAAAKDAAVAQARKTRMPTPERERQSRTTSQKRQTATTVAEKDSKKVVMVNTRKSRRTLTPESEERRTRVPKGQAQTAKEDADSDDAPLIAVAKTRKTRRTSEPEDRPNVTRKTAAMKDSDDEPLEPRRSTRSQSTRNDSDDEPLATRRNTRSRPAREAHSKKRLRKRSVESDGDDSYHDPTSEEDRDTFWDAALHLSETEEDSVPATQEVTSQGELLPQLAEQPTSINPTSAGQGRPHGKTQRPSYASSHHEEPLTEAQPSPRQNPPAEHSPSPTSEDPPVEQREPPRESSQVRKCRQDLAEQARTMNDRQRSMSPARQPSRKYQRGQNNDRVHTDGRSSNSTLFLSLNPYDRPGKPWGEFVVEVLLAERTARNEDELDYVQFVRGLYEI